MEISARLNLFAGNTVPGSMKVCWIVSIDINYDMTLRIQRRKKLKTIRNLFLQEEVSRESAKVFQNSHVNR